MIKGIKPLQNSCYIDSVIISLLHNSNGIFTKLIFSSNSKLGCILQEYSQKINNNIDIEDINMQNLIDICSEIQTNKSNVYPDYNNQEPQDAEEFIQFILNELCYNETMTSTLEIETTLNYTDSKNNRDLIKSLVQNEKTPIYALTPTTHLSIVENADFEKCISLTKLLERGEIITHTDINVIENKKSFDKLITERRIKSTSFVIITIPRLALVEPNFMPYKKTQELLPDETMIINGNTLILTSIIAHLGSHNAGHYISFFINNNIWYLYDSTIYNQTNEFISIGTFNDLLNLGCNDGLIVKTCATIFIYEKST